MSDENATTEYGTWADYDRSRVTVEDTVTDAAGDFADDYDLVAATATYREAINAALPSGIVLAGDGFYGPYPRSDDAGEQIAEAVDKVDLYEILAEHERA